MSETDHDSKESLVRVARAVRTRGLKGEVVAELLTDFPERFEDLDELVAIAPDGKTIVVELENFWTQNGRGILKFVGFDDPDTARIFVGYDFAVPEADRVSLPKDQYYNWELEGCAVRQLNGELVGKVKEILKTAGPDILVISVDNQKEVLVPLAEEIVLKIDTVNKTIVIDPPEGLLEL
ncbi:MAG: 16S rRNA processing protein RimM [Blastocatellia bacterium]|nr:MAG: 16S rRNA processing protein RimM [Blastocatellia bacterium]